MQVEKFTEMLTATLKEMGFGAGTITGDAQTSSAQGFAISLKDVHTDDETAKQIPLVAFSITSAAERLARHR